MFHAEPNHNEAASTHRQRTQNYIKALEQEVVRLREMETQMMMQKETLHARVNVLEHTLSQHGIHAPPDTDQAIASAMDDFLLKQTAEVSLNNKRFKDPTLHVQFPQTAPDVFRGVDQRPNAPVAGSQAYDSSRVNGLTSSHGTSKLSTRPESLFDC